MTQKFYTNIYFVASMINAVDNIILFENRDIKRRKDPQRPFEIINAQQKAHVTRPTYLQ